MSAIFLWPAVSQARGLSNDVDGLHKVLEELYNEMIPMCSDLIGIAQGIAGFGALWYIGSRVWRHIANAEPIDFYPLFRPFVLGFAIMMFPMVLNIMNGVLKPTVTATEGMMKGSNDAIAKLLKAKEKQVKASDPWKMFVGTTGDGDRDRWYKFTHSGEDPSEEGFFDGIGNDVKFAMSKASYNFRNSIKEWMSEVLQVVYMAASLCINTLRTFNLVVLAILGPIVFGLAVFDGFQNSLSSWFARYINFYLWLPVANIFGCIIGKIQQKMLIMDISEIKNQGDTVFSSSDTAYLVFMLIAIVGYMTVPTVAGYIVNAGGGGALVQKVTSLMSSSVTTGGAIASATGSRAINGAGNILGAPGNIKEGYTGVNGGSGGYAKVGATIGKTGAYMKDKIAGS